MILNRIVELQAHSVIRNITDNQEEYEYIENLIESKKPPSSNSFYHYLISTPFRYPLPVEPANIARFRPPFYNRNSFYGAEQFRTSAYEYAYHWLRQRVHIPDLSQEPQPRTHFKVSFNDPKIMDIRSRKNIDQIMDRNDYAASHKFINTQQNVTSIIYPSSRDPLRGNCVVTFEITTLGKDPKKERNLDFVYQSNQRMCIIQNPLSQKELYRIKWQEVS